MHEFHVLRYPKAILQLEDPLLPKNEIKEI